MDSGRGSRFEFDEASPPLGCCFLHLSKQQKSTSQNGAVPVQGVSSDRAVFAPFPYPFPFSQSSLMVILLMVYFHSSDVNGLLCLHQQQQHRVERR